MILIAATTLVGTIAMYFGFKALVEEGRRVEEGIEAGASPLWQTDH